MKHRKHGTRLLGLLVVAALGVMGFAASAQAVAPGFLINKKVGGSGLFATVSIEQVGTGTLLVPGLNFKLSCTKTITDEGKTTSNTDATFVLLLTGCTTLSITKSPEEIHCHVTEPIKAEALVLPTELKKPTLNAPAFLMERIKALVKLHLPEASLGTTACVLPLDNIITGEVCLAIDNNDTVEPTVLADATIECKERTSLESGSEGSGGITDVVKYGAQTVTFDFAAKMFLTGEHKGLAIGVSLF